mgnify:CR=1 FL=1
MKQVKLTNELAKALKEYANNNIRDEKEVLRQYGFKDDDNVSLYDFIDFSRYFGLDKEKYLLFRPLRDDANVTWEEIANLKYGDIDFTNNTITFRSKIN